MTTRTVLVAAAGVALAMASVGADGPVVAAGTVEVTAQVTTAPLYNYEDAPATPDADDPAIWTDRRDPRRSLVIGTAKDAGLLVYDLSGRLLQAIRPPNARQVLPADPATPAGVNVTPDAPCADSDSGETFGRFNNVDIAYDVRLGPDGKGPATDVAIVSDRGCDRIRFYRIAPLDPAGPLVDVTASDVPRVFPDRYDQPSLVQPSGDPRGWRPNPVDDQNTAYGLAVAPGRTVEIFVSQRERGLVRQLDVLPAPGGRLTYRLQRTFLFETNFDLTDRKGDGYTWTPCREAVEEEPQSEGLVFDRTNATLYAAFETIGLYRLPLGPHVPRFVRIGADRLIEPVTTFGQGYQAIPDDGDFSCDYDASSVPATGAIVAPGSTTHAGRFLQADLEGLSIIASRPGRTLMLASSQGDSSFHLYSLVRATATHLGAFLIDGVAETDGVHYSPVPIGAAYPLGLLVVQNGQAPPPEHAGDVNGYEFDGATQFKFVSFLDAIRGLMR